MIKIFKKANLSTTGFSLVLLLSFVAICNYGCSSNRNKELMNDNSALQLNNGEKWQANSETTNGINNMKLLLKDWPESSSLEEHTILKSKLENEFKHIFKNCTMTGQAHDELHNYLIPLKELINQIDNPEIASLNNKMINLEDHLELYSEYFE